MPAANHTDETSGAPRHRRDGGVLVLWFASSIAVAVCVLWSLAVVHAQTPDPDADIKTAGDPARWRAIWDQMMPVLMHPRCLNCHGVTNPFTGDNHGGGPVAEDTECITCHTENTKRFIESCIEPSPEFPGFPGRAVAEDGSIQPADCTPGTNFRDFRTSDGRPTWNGPAPERVWFVRRDAATICRQFKEGTSGPSGVLFHLKEDGNVGLAFEGRKGMDSQSEFWPVDAEPPPVSRNDLVELARQWITQAAGACDLNGTITITETLQGSRTVSLGASAIGSGTTTQEESGSRTVTAEVRNGKANVSIQGSGQEKSTTRIVASAGGTSCVTLDTSESTASSSASGEGTLNVAIAPDGSYTISLTGPPETGSQRLGSGRVQNSCLAALNQDVPGEQIQLSKQWPYSVKGQRDPNTEVLRGSSTVTVPWTRSGQLGPDIPWLLYGMTLVPEEGSPPTATITATWDLTLY